MEDFIFVVKWISAWHLVCNTSEFRCMRMPGVRIAWSIWYSYVIKKGYSCLLVGCSNKFEIILEIILRDEVYQLEIFLLFQSRRWYTLKVSYSCENVKIDKVNSRVIIRFWKRLYNPYYCSYEWWIVLIAVCSLTGSYLFNTCDPFLKTSNSSHSIGYLWTTYFKTKSKKKKKKYLAICTSCFCLIVMQYMAS